MFRVSLGEGQANDTMTYDTIIKWIDRQIQRDSELKDKVKFLFFRKITDHRTIKLSRSSYELIVNGEDGHATWYPISVMIRNYPINLAKYARDNELLNNPGRKKPRCYVNNTKKMSLILKADKYKKSRNTVRIKFLMKIPCNNKELMIFDTRNGNTNWKDAGFLELK